MLTAIVPPPTIREAFVNNRSEENMSFVIAIQGVQSEKIVDGQAKQVIPFVGADREGEFAQMGVGVLLPEEGKASIWGCVVPHLLIQSWRGMRILEKIGRIDRGTLCACWTVARRELHNDDDRYLDELADQAGEIDKFQALREETLASVPNADELQAMITILREKGVGVDSWELKAEVEAGRITMMPLIETLVREDEDRRLAYRRQEDEVKKSVPPEESLGAFFRALGIGNFIISPAIGGYGMDWGHHELDELDQIAKRDSMSKYLPDGHFLEHTTQGPDTAAVRLAPGITSYSTSFGEIERPWYVDETGTKYTFLSAKWADGHFYVRVLIEHPAEQGPPEAATFTVPQLRALIKIPPSSWWTGVMQKARSIF